MISTKMKYFVENGSAVRAMFEEGKQMAQEYGAENVCDFSLGNPNCPPPDAVTEAFLAVLKETDPVELHGYMSNPGFEDVRAKIAASLNDRFQMDYAYENIIMSVGAAGGLNVVFSSLLNPGDGILVFAPFFGEYRNFALCHDAECSVVPASIPTFQPNLEAFEEMLGPKTRIVIVNTPNNPTGVVYTEETIVKLAEILRRKQEEYGAPIYLIADEPYRELVYDGIDVPFIPKYYDNTIVVYSYSKSLSLPGERIGYIAVSRAADDAEMICAAAGTATRLLGFVNGPSLLQKTVARCLDAKVNVGFYDANRKAIYNGLTEMGYDCINPDGAFYLWVKSPVEDEMEFISYAKKYQILLVAGTFFGCPGYFRIAYCVAPETIQTALPKFKELIDHFRK